jgi:ribulose-5-phosphate 4-epimerase/fuculose-1-phosphate aldolase
MQKCSLQEWIAVALAIHALALAIANLTPTPKDNEMLARFYRVIEILAGLVSPLAKR